MTLAWFVAAIVVGGAPPVVAAAPADRIAPVAIRVIPAAAPEPARAPRNRTDLVCRSTRATGSLIVRTNTCLTRKQWAYVDDDHKREARRIVATAVGGVGQ